MPPIPFVSSGDGQRLTVNQMLKSPTLIPRRIISMMDQQFLVDALLRSAPGAPSGAIIYWESTPLYANGDAAVVEEFGEIPATTGNLGTPKAVRTIKRGLAVKVSQEMQDRNDVDAVNTQINQVKNTMVRSWEDTFLAALLGNAMVTQSTAAAAWGGNLSTARIRGDLGEAMFAVTDARSDGPGGSNYFGFTPDTLLISNRTATDFLESDDVAKVYLGGDLASQNLMYTGAMPRQFFGLDVVKSWRMPAGKAVVLQRKIVGGISDERPLRTTPMYEDKPRETWRCDTTRASAIFIDQPKAACIINGV